MRRCVWIVTIALGGCHRTPTARERALDHLPADAVWIAAADGPALASPAFRKAIDAARPRIPPSFSCVIDAAITGDAIAVAADPKGIAVVVIAARAITCPGLARIEPDVWAATIGAPGPGAGVLEAPRWRRAREFLVSAPLAFAADLGDVHAIATVQAEPAAAWLTIDAADPETTERSARAWVARLGADKLQIARHDAQIEIELGDADLGALAEAGVREIDAYREPMPAFACPQGAHCRDVGGRTRVVALPLSPILQALRPAHAEPVVENGEVAGVRVSGATALLEDGDVVTAIDAHRVRTSDELAARLAAAHDPVVLDVRRGGVTAVVEVTGSE